MVEWWNGGMVEWWNGGMAQWQNGRMAEWWNGRMVEWWNGGMAEWQNGKMAEWRNGRMADWHNVWYEIVLNQDTESTQMPPWQSPSRLVGYNTIQLQRLLRQHHPQQHILSTHPTCQRHLQQSKSYYHFVRGWTSHILKHTFMVHLSSLPSMNGRCGIGYQNQSGIP